MPCPALLEPDDQPGSAPARAPVKVRARVPYISSWSSERLRVPPLTVRGDRRSGSIGYVNERNGDRDASGGLWARCESRPGWGTPEFGRMHPVRQRRAIGGLLCSLCGRTTAREQTARGHLYVLNRQDYEVDRAFGTVVTAEPPVHVECARLAVGGPCPNLRDFVALRANRRRIHGVHGRIMVPDRTGTLRCAGLDTVPRDDWRIRWVVGLYLNVHLQDYVEVDLDAEVSARAS